VAVCGDGRSYLDVWGEGARERLVYLTSDSENVLTELDNDKVGRGYSRRESMSGGLPCSLYLAGGLTLTLCGPEPSI
jgi:hypothetical protein